MTDETTDKKPVPANTLRRLLYWLTQDWIDLSSTLPTPTSNGGRTSNTREYGHPAEWASDKCAEITDHFHGWHDYLAEQRNEKRPPARDNRRIGTEQTIIVNAWRYLETRIPQLINATDPNTEPFQELFDIHREIRARTCRTRPRYTLPMPCPHIDCGLRTLQRISGVGQDFIMCDACGYTIKDEHYPWLIRVTLDTLIDSAA